MPSCKGKGINTSNRQVFVKQTSWHFRNNDRKYPLTAEKYIVGIKQFVTPEYLLPSR